MDRIKARIQKLYPTLKVARDFSIVAENGVEHLTFWNSANGPQPTDAELLAVDLTQPTAEENSLRTAVQILKADVPEGWKDSVNAQQRIAWAFKRLFVEVRAELKD